MNQRQRPDLEALLQALSTYVKLPARSHLPWRKTHNPYHVLVSEIMLQQTQVERVTDFYRRFLQQFPTVSALADAPRSEVLRAWQGLGYNRRAKFLHEAAQVIVKKHKGKMPRKVYEMEQLPGVGPYTARAVAAFAYNEPEVFIETNIRTVFLHHCFARAKKPISDKKILPLIAYALAQSALSPRDFYAALMDYGTELKRHGVRLNTKSAHYVRQSKFEGSRRQVRGGIIRALLKGPAPLSVLARALNKTGPEVRGVLTQLLREKMVQKVGQKYALLD